MRAAQTSLPSLLPPIVACKDPSLQQGLHRKILLLATQLL